jgi:hypothetical protein
MQTKENAVNIRLAAAVAVVGTATWLMRPNFAACRELLSPAISAAIERDGADAVLLTLAGAALWLALAWLLVALAALGASTIPGWIGAWGERLSRAALPAPTRRILAVALGIGLVIGPGLAATASAEGAGPAGIAAPAWPISPPQWPTSPQPGADQPAWAPAPAADPDPEPSDSPGAGQAPGSTAPAPGASAGTPAAAAEAPAAQAADVVVAAGDSLWSIAASHLPAQPSDSDIAAAWPAWQSANPEAIGGNPNLIHPGQVLHPPSPPERR